MLFNQISHNSLTVLYGKSGSGKSSLINAGIKPILKKKGYLPITIRASDLIRSHNVSSYVIDQVTKVAKRNKLVEYDSLKGTYEDITLWEFFHRYSLKRKPKQNTVSVLMEGSDELVQLEENIVPVLILDQFEEIFTLADRK